MVHFSCLVQEKKKGYYSEQEGVFCSLFAMENLRSAWDPIIQGFQNLQASNWQGFKSWLFHFYHHASLLS